MFEVLYPIAAMILVSSSAIAGALISFFTKLEMETYEKTISKWSFFAGAALLIFVAAMTFNAGYIIALVIGLAFGWLGAKKESSLVGWAFFGVFAGSLFAFDARAGFLAAALMVVFVFLRSTALNIPFVLKKKKFVKIRLFEQAIFLAFAVTFYFVMGITASYAGAAVTYVAIGALSWMFWKEAVTSYF